MTNAEKAKLAKRLRSCGSGYGEVCEGCPYRDEADCSGMLLMEAAKALEDDADWWEEE